MTWILLGLGLAFAAPCEPDAARAQLAASVGDLAPDDVATACVATDDAQGERLRAALDASPRHAGLSRALALWMLARADLPFDDADVARLVADDLRLVGDGLRARRGRATPVLAHARIFARAGWYRPVANWTPGLLREVDRVNIAKLEAPPTPDAAAAPAPVDLPPPPPLEVEPPGLCGCASTSGGAPRGAVLLTGLIVGIAGRRATRGSRRA